MAVNDNFTLRPLCFLWRNADTPWNKLAVFFWGTALQTGRSRVRFPMVSLEFCHWHNPSGRTMTLGSTQSLTEMSTRNISLGGKGGWWVGLTTLPPSCADCLGIWEPNLLEPSGLVQGCTGIAFPLPFTLEYGSGRSLDPVRTFWIRQSSPTLSAELNLSVVQRPVWEANRRILV